MQLESPRQLPSAYFLPAEHKRPTSNDAKTGSCKFYFSLYEKKRQPMPRSNNSYRKRYHHNAPSCLYIGAGWDMSPVAKLPRVQHFILIDSLPEHQIYAPHEPEWQFTHTACALADKIHRELQQAARARGTRVRSRAVQETNTGAPLYVWHLRDGAEIRYYMNCEFPRCVRQNPALLNRVKHATVLYVSGWCPGEAVFALAANLRDLVVTSLCAERMMEVAPPHTHIQYAEDLGADRGMDEDDTDSQSEASDTSDTSDTSHTTTSTQCSS